MTDVFYVKQGSTSPSITSTLLDPDGDPVDLTGASVTFRMVGPDTITGAADIDADPTTGRVSYDWQPGDLDQWGGYAVEWVVVDNGNTDVFPGPGYDWVDVVPIATTTLGGVCTLVDVRRALGRALADAEAMLAADLIGQLTAILERRLHRVFATRTITETHWMDRLGRLSKASNSKSIVSSRAPAPWCQPRLTWRASVL